MISSDVHLNAPTIRFEIYVKVNICVIIYILRVMLSEYRW